jgi:type IV secretory pathway VirB10-like protein
MRPTIRAHAHPLVLLVAVAALPLGLSLLACGGGEPPSATTPTATVTATAAASTAALPTTTAPPPDTAASAAPPPPPPVPTSSVATTKSDPSWVACHASFKAKGKEVSQDVEAMAKLCAAPTKMKLVGKTLTGKQADQDAPQTFPFDAKAGRCYRAYAQASDGIKDLDLVVKDSAGVIVGQDTTDDSSPVVMEDGAVCFSKDDKAAVVVSVGMGKGSYAVQIWGG